MKLPTLIVSFAATALAQSLDVDSIPYGEDCYDVAYAQQDMITAANASLNYYINNQTVSDGTDKYPFVQSYDWLNSLDEYFGCSDPSGTYLEFPIIFNETTVSFPAYDGGDAGPDRIIIDVSEDVGFFCGLITKDTDQSTGWTVCEDIGG